MDDPSRPSLAPGGASARFARRLLSIGENRFHLLMVEVQEERDRLVGMVFLAIATAALGLLGGIAWSAALVIFFWETSPIRALLILGAVYAAAAIVLCRRLAFRRQQQAFTATLDQLRKDRACLTKN